MPITALDYAHIRLTVTDITVSRAFYESVFGFEVAFEAPPADADPETKEELGFLFGGVIYRFGGGLLGLRPVAAGGDRFDEDRTGLDHLSVSVGGRAEIDAAVDVLDALLVSHGPVKDAGGMWILEFRDPDGIALELSAEQ